MLINFKTNNEYEICGKRYIQKINDCYVDKKSNGEYTLVCAIHQRGQHFYDYWQNWGYIRKGNKKLYLSDEAKKIIEDAINKFNKAVVESRNKDYRSIYIPEMFTILYKSNKHKFDFVIKYIDKYSNKNCIQVFRDYSLLEMIEKINWIGMHIKDYDKCYMDNINRNSINENPFIKSAQEYNDTELEYKLKLYYKVADRRICEFLSKLFNERILPTLSEEYNKDYYVDADTIDYKLLIRSGYTILHRPYFAMIGSTHTKYTLNPYTKYGVDAAKEDEPSIAFIDYLELFE